MHRLTTVGEMIIHVSKFFDNAVDFVSFGSLNKRFHQLLLAHVTDRDNPQSKALLRFVKPKIKIEDKIDTLKKYIESNELPNRKLHGPQKEYYRRTNDAGEFLNSGVERDYVEHDMFLGQKHGKRRQWSPTALTSEEEWKNNMLDGLKIAYDETRAPAPKDEKEVPLSSRVTSLPISRSTSYKKNKIDGEQRDYENGYLVTSTHYKAGKKEGEQEIWITFKIDNIDCPVLISRSTYENNEQTREETWDDGGSGVRVGVRHFKNGESHGEELVWYPNGVLALRACFENGEGRFSFGYWPDGKLRTKQEFSEEGECTLIEQYDENGVLIPSNDFDDDDDDDDDE